MAKTNNNAIVIKPFDICEAVVLLDVYLFGKENNLTNTEMAKIASMRLRNLAKSRGMNVSDSFRSPAGLQNRLRCIGFLFEGSECKSAPGTVVFNEAVSLYHNNKQSYLEILSESENLEHSSSKTTAALQKRTLKKTKYVRTKKDQQLKDGFNKQFIDVYYALKRQSEKNKDGVTATEIFIYLDRIIKRKIIIEILENASWSMSVDRFRYVFYDKDQDKRKKQKMEESLKNAENEFFMWLPSAIPPHKYKEIKSSYKIVSSMLLQKKIISQPLVLTTQIGQFENARKQVKKVFGGKKLRANAITLLNAYIDYLREKKQKKLNNTEICDMEINSDWLRFDFTNSDDFERTNPTYCCLGNAIIEGKTWARILVGVVEHEIATNNPDLEILYKKPLFPGRTDRPFIMENRIEGVNCSILSNGYWINVNRSIPRLIEIILGFCLHCGYNKNQIVLYGVTKGNDLEKSKTSKKKSISYSLDFEKIEDYLRSVGLKGATITEIMDAVQIDASVRSTKSGLDRIQSVISMPGNRYVHEDCFVDLDEAEEEFDEILRTHFTQFDGYSNNQLLYGAAAQEMSLFLNDNDCLSVDAVYAIVRHLFEKKETNRKRYKFYPPHIFENEPDYPASLRGLMINIARKNNGVLVSDEAKNFLQKTMLAYGSLGQLLQIGSSNTFLLYDEKMYLLSEAIGIDDSWCCQINKQLDELFKKANVAYIIPRDINTTWFSALPDLPMNLNWTRLLLQDILYKYPTIGFKPIFAELSQSFSTLAAAIVPIESPLQSFPDIVTLFMEERYQLPIRMSGESLRRELRDAGMLEEREMIYSLPKALADYRFAWTDENKTVFIRGNR